MGQYKVDEDRPRVPRPAATYSASMSASGLLCEFLNKSLSMLPPEYPAGRAITMSRGGQLYEIGTISAPT